MYLLLFLNGIDPFLGKVNKAAFCQQTLMELLIEKFESNHSISRTPEGAETISDWYGVRVNLDEKREVVAIEWANHMLEGEIQLQWIPLMVQTFDVSHNNLSGEIHLEDLPIVLVKLYLSYNEFTGEVNLRDLPEEIEFLSLADNHLRGSIDFTHLPSKLQHLSLYRNKFCGEPDFSQLPRSLKYLDVSNTQLSGKVRIGEGTKFVLTNSKVRV